MGAEQGGITRGKQKKGASATKRFAQIVAMTALGRHLHRFRVVGSSASYPRSEWDTADRRVVLKRLN